MITQTIQSFAITMSDGGLGAYVIVDLARTVPDAIVPKDLPHGIGAMVDGEKTAIEFMAGEDDAGDAYREIVAACMTHTDVMHGTISLIEDGEVEMTAIKLPSIPQAPRKQA